MVYQFSSLPDGLESLTGTYTNASGVEVAKETYSRNQLTKGADGQYIVSVKIPNSQGNQYTAMFTGTGSPSGFSRMTTMPLSPKLARK